MLDKNSDVSRLVDRMYSKKLVERKESSLDRRQKKIKISLLGLDLLERTDKCEQEMDKLVSTLSVSETKTLNNLLDKMRSQ